jgi:hypothetical protein
MSKTHRIELINQIEFEDSDDIVVVKMDPKIREMMLLLYLSTQNQAQNVLICYVTEAEAILFYCVSADLLFVLKNNIY